MKRVWSLLLLLLTGVGCGHDPERPISADPYLPFTSPENLVLNLETAYRQLDIDAYLQLLHPEFFFYLQPVDARDLGADFRGYDADSAWTAALFSDPNVTDIRIELTILKIEPINSLSASDVAPFDSTLVRVDAFLEIDVTENGVPMTRDLGGLWDFLFVRSDGEHHARWYILEWRVISTAWPEGISAGFRRPCSSEQ